MPPFHVLLKCHRENNQKGFLRTLPEQIKILNNFEKVVLIT